MNRAALRRIVKDKTSLQGRTFEILSQLAIVVWLAAYSIDTLPDLSARPRTLLNGTETAVVLLFTLEYVLRPFTVENRWRFATSFFGIVDLLSIPPFYLLFAVDLQTLRVLRLLRLTRVLKLGRYNRAWSLARDEVLMFLFVALLLLFVAAAGIHHFEHDAQPDKFSSIFDSLWWAVATLTTVGYGDVYPVTTGGTIFAFVILMIGLGIVAVPAGLVTAALTEVRRRESPPERPEAIDERRCSWRSDSDDQNRGSDNPRLRTPYWIGGATAPVSPAAAARVTTHAHREISTDRTRSCVRSRHEFRRSNETFFGGGDSHVGD